MTTRSLDELKATYISIVKDILDKNLDLIIESANASLNNDETAAAKYAEVQKLGAKYVQEHFTEEEYRQLQPHIISMTLEVARLVLPRLSN